LVTRYSVIGGKVGKGKGKGKGKGNPLTGPGGPMG
jgi:hypothetical protein